MPCDKSTFERLLPALQHLSKFPSANRAVISSRFGLTQVDVDAYMNAAAGSIVNYDEEAFAADADKYGIKVGSYQPPKPTFIKPKDDDEPLTVTAAPAKPRAPRPAVARQPSPAPVMADSAPNTAPAATPDPEPPISMKNTDIPPKIAAVCRILSGDADISESAACTKAGISQSYWSSWKKKRFGRGPVPRGKLGGIGSSEAANERLASRARKRRAISSVPPQKLLEEARLAPPPPARRKNALQPPPVATVDGSEADKVIRLLLAGGYVSEDKVRQAREFARIG